MVGENKEKGYFKWFRSCLGDISLGRMLALKVGDKNIVFK